MDQPQNTTPATETTTTVPPTNTAPAQDGAQNMQINMSNDKLMAIIAYFIFFVPLIVGSKSPFVRFHTNQATVLFVLNVGWWIGSIFLSAVPFIGLLLIPISLVFHLGLFVFWIMGIVGAAKDEMKPLPMIGGIKIIS